MGKGGVYRTDAARGLPNRRGHSSDVYHRENKTNIIGVALRRRATSAPTPVEQRKTPATQQENHNQPTSYLGSSGVVPW